MFYFIMFKLFALSITDIQNIRNFDSLTASQIQELDKFRNIYSSLRFEKRIFYSTCIKINIKQEAINLCKELNLNNLTLIKDQKINIDFLKSFKANPNKLEAFTFLVNDLLCKNIITFNLIPTIRQLLYIADLLFIYTIFITADKEIYKLHKLINFLLNKRSLNTSANQAQNNHISNLPSTSSRNNDYTNTIINNLSYNYEDNLTVLEGNYLVLDNNDICSDEFTETNNYTSQIQNKDNHIPNPHSSKNHNNDLNTSANQDQNNNTNRSATNNNDDYEADLALDEFGQSN